MQALCFPLGSSVALLVMFFFFDSMQTLVAICTAIIACAALAFLLTPLCQYVAGGGAFSRGAVCGRYSPPELAAALLSAAIVAVWVLTGHWLLMDGTPAENPMNVVARRLQLGGAMRDAPKLSLPAKLVFPSMHHQGHFSMLGLGDIVMPGLLLCFVLRYDAYKKANLVCQMGQVPGPRSMGSRLTYFHCSLLGYFLGLLTATVSAEVFKAAQPALLYLVPFTLLPLLTMAYVKVYRHRTSYFHCSLLGYFLGLLTAMVSTSTSYALSLSESHFQSYHIPILWAIAVANGIWERNE
ncbi:Signal peptide peptidase [Operophtera brumata]|uniref:Signal peptide peptidase n=1 Tax=Operophtera brumata TaxID=104452 RepID=A0A0L7KWW2_OPEBR|nr:Signal peptide peptidase [Operophtera brumata]